MIIVSISCWAWGVWYSACGQLQPPGPNCLDKVMLEMMTMTEANQNDAKGADDNRSPIQSSIKVCKWWLGDWWYQWKEEPSGSNHTLGHFKVSFKRRVSQTFIIKSMILTHNHHVIINQQNSINQQLSSCSSSHICLFFPANRIEFDKQTKNEQIKSDTWQLQGNKLASSKMRKLKSLQANKLINEQADKLTSWKFTSYQTDRWKKDLMTRWKDDMVKW